MPTRSSTSPRRWNCWSPPSCPRRPPTSGSTWYAGAVRPLPERRRLRGGRPGRDGEDHPVQPDSSGPRPAASSAWARPCVTGTPGEVPGKLADLGHPARGRPEDGATSSSATRSACPASPWTRTSPGCSRRFGWTKQTDPVKIEQEVGALIRGRSGTILIPPADLARQARLPRPQARLRSLWHRRLCPSYGEGPRLTRRRPARW